MKRQLVRETVINKRTLLFYRPESGSYTLVVERSGMSWGSFLTLEEAEAFALSHTHGGKVNDVSRQGASLRWMFESV